MTGVAAAAVAVGVGMFLVPEIMVPATTIFAII